MKVDAKLFIGDKRIDLQTLKKCLSEFCEVTHIHTDTKDTETSIDIHIRTVSTEGIKIQLKQSIEEKNIGGWF